MAEFNGRPDDNPEGVWSSHTCVLGWPVQGIWPRGADNSDINAVDRSINGKYLASADDFGKIKVFRNPVIEEGKNFLEYGGHSSHVTCTRWTASNNLTSVMTVCY